MRIELVKEVASTNDYIRRYLSGGENITVCAERQTGGKGTKGRSFLSEEGGVYLSELTFYQGLPAREAFRVMMRAAVSVCKTVEAFGFTPEIKWPNDILIDGKKVCGILIENFFEGEKIKASIVGIGLNVRNDVSSLGGIAFSLKERAPSLTVREVRSELLGQLQKEVRFSDYRRYVRTGTVLIEENNTTYSAVILEVMEDGRLKVETDGAEKLLSAAEIKRIL